MATRELYWLGASGDWTSTSNWSLTRGGTGGEAAPDSDDNVWIFDGTTDITTNIGAAAAQAIRIGGDFQGNIGAAGTSLTVATTGCAITVESVGKQYVNLAASTTVASVGIVGTGAGVVNLGSGTFTAVNCGASGTVNVDGGCVVVTLRSCGMKVLAAYNGTAFTTLDIEGGIGHEIRRAVTTLLLGGGAKTFSAVTVGTGTLTRGGQLTHDSVGTITALHVKPGSQAIAGLVPFIVTDSTLWEGGRLFANASTGQVTYTNATTFYGRTGRS